MSNFLLKILKLFILFGKNTWGCINRPYITYRRLSGKTVNPGQTIFIFILAIGYFTFASLLRTGMRNPYLLTIKFNSLLAGGMIGFLGIVVCFFILGKLVKVNVQLLTVFVLWAYSLLPTIIWFFFTSFMFLLLPPPRTLSIWGKLYSVFFMAFSFAVAFWKLILYYLTLRFALRLDLFRIVFISMILTPIFAGYSVLMYRLGIFRIPFV